jgi:class 3 adenylate cyclase
MGLAGLRALVGRSERGLTAIMFTDIEGHTAQVQKDEARALPDA